MLTVSSSGQCTLATIHVAPETATIHVSQTQDFTATAYDSCGNRLTGLTFTWASDKPAVATVFDGLATGVTPGLAGLTAKSGQITSNRAVLTVLMMNGLDETAYLYAVAGADSYAAGNNGTQTIVYATVGAGGALSAWKTAAQDTTKRLMGLQALLYFDFMFSFGGAQKDDPGSVTATNTVERFAWQAADGDLVDKQNTGAQMGSGRAYFSLLRVNPFIYAIGGSSGGGLLPTTERIPQ